jgi:hypothetical protein
VTIQELLAKKPDEIERAIVKALADAGKTTHGREWYTPTAIGVHSLSFIARAANGMGQPQIAGVCALLYGLLDIFGISGSVRIALAARNQMIRKMQPNNNLHIPSGWRIAKRVICKPWGEKVEEEILEKIPQGETNGRKENTPNG